MSETTLRKQLVGIAMPNKGFSNSERITSKAYGVPFLADAYLYNGEPINRLTGAGQLIRNVQPLERAEVAAALARAHPIQTKFSGYQSFGNAINQSARVKNPTNYKKSQQ